MHRKKKYIQVQVKIMEQEMCASLLWITKNNIEIYTITGPLQVPNITKVPLSLCDSSE